jgi:tetratricopeptide (TPR) repeat protein
MDLFRYFPIGGRGTIIVTTRNPDYVCYATVGSFEIGVMKLSDAVTLLLKTAGKDETDDCLRASALRIVEDLGRLALAITQAGAFIRELNYTMEEYRDEYSTCQKELLSRQPNQDDYSYAYTVYTTWEISVQAIMKMAERIPESTAHETASDAIEVLQFFSFLHFDGISERILKEAWSNMRSPVQLEWALPYELSILRKSGSWVSGRRRIRKALNLLSSYSLITIDRTLDDHNRISLHPLVHWWSKSRLIEAEQTKFWLIAATTLAISVSSEFQSSDYRFRRFLLPHIDSCLKCHNGRLLFSDDVNRWCLEIAIRFARPYHEGGRLKEAAQLQEGILKASKAIFGEEHRNTLATMNNLSICYGDLGRSKEAVELKEKALEACKEGLGEEHPRTLAAMANLAESYRRLHRRNNPIELEEEILEAQKRVLGERHPDTLAAMINLGHSYESLGRSKEAVELEEKALEVCKRVLGEEHPRTLAAMANLAESYRRLHRRNDSIELEEEILEAQKGVLGEGHPRTLTVMINLGYGYEGLGRSKEAAELEEKALETCKKVLGEEHPATLAAMVNLAVSYRSLGRTNDSAELEEKALEAQRRVWGEESRGALTTMNNLAVSYRSLGRFKEAAELQAKALETQVKVVGEGHTNTPIFMSNLAALYRHLGRLKEAAELEEKAREARERISGEGPPSKAQ